MNFSDYLFGFFGPRYPPAPQVVPEAERPNTYEHRSLDEYEWDIESETEHLREAREDYHPVLEVHENKSTFKGRNTRVKELTNG